MKAWRATTMAGIAVLIGAMWQTALVAQTREQKVRGDREKVTKEGFWIYNDLAKGFAEAKRTGKPLVVVLRCIPCEECVKLDDDLVDRDPVIRPLLEQYVCVRQVSTNGLDLATFQYDTDQSFAMFFLNGDGTIYGRFGTRSHRTEWDGDVSLTGLADALRGGLALHAKYPANREELAGKRGPKPTVASPELFPSLKDKFKATLDYEGNVVKGCIHCHQIGDAQRDMFRAARQPIPDETLFPYPHPKSIGLVMDTEERARVKEVKPETWAALAGFQAGDEILRLQGQPLLSIADIQWVLHRVPATGGEVVAQVRREGTLRELKLDLPADWRLAGDISWRVSSWGLRRMTTGGLVLREASDEERGELQVPSDKMALRVEYVGQYDEHAAAKREGFQKGDVLLSFDGRDDLRREADLFRHGVQQRKPGDRVDVDVLREGRRLKLKLPMQR